MKSGYRSEREGIPSFLVVVKGLTVDFFFLGTSTLALEKGLIPFLRKISSKDKVGLDPRAGEVDGAVVWEMGLVD